MFKTEGTLARIRDTASHPTLAIGNHHPNFSGFEKAGQLALARAVAQTKEVAALIEAARAETEFVEPLAASTRTILALLHFEAALIVDGIVSQPLPGADALENGCAAIDQIRRFLSGAAAFRATYLDSGKTCIGASRTVERLSESGEKSNITITIREDLSALVGLVSSARGHLTSAEAFGMWLKLTY